MPVINETPYSRFATQVHNEIVRPLRTKLIARRTATINPTVKGDGITALEIFSVSSMSDATVSYSLPTGDGHSDSLTSSAEIVKLPVIHKQFQIQKSEYNAWERRSVSPGTENSIDSETASAASHVVSKQEEQIIIDGWKPNGTVYEIKGYWQAANNSVVGGALAAPGDAYDYIADAIGKLNEDEVNGDNEAYNVIVSPAIYTKIRKSVYPNTGIREMDEVMKLLNGGQLLSSGILTANNATKDGAIVLPVDATREHFELINPVDYRVEFANPKYPSLSPIEGVVYSLMRPYFKRTNAEGKSDAVCKITGLSSV